MIVRARVIVTMNGAPITDGAVHIGENRIATVGKSWQVTAVDEQVIELGGYALLPGLINAHCHLDYTCLRGRIPPQRSFTDWIRAINAKKAKLTAKDYRQSIAEGFREAERFGTTAIVNLEAYPEVIARSPATPLRMWWCPELIDVSAPARTEEIVFHALESRSVVQENNGGFGLAPHALFTASPELFLRCQQVARADDLLLTTHLAESREEMAMFRDGAGPLFDFLRELGRPLHDCGAQTPLERFVSILQGVRRDPSTSLRFARDDGGAAAVRWIVAHLNELTEGDFEILAKIPQEFSIAHCPRSHAYFEHSPFAFEHLRNLGFNICLATDSLASNIDLSLFAEMRAFHQAHPQLSGEEILKMVTTNPAEALGRGKDLGKIAPDHLADMIAVPITGSRDIHEQIIAFAGEVPWMMIAGNII